MRPAYAFACALACAGPLGAQLRPAAHPRCTVTAHAALTADDDIDPRSPPALLALGDVTVVAWRSRAGTLRAQRFAPDLRFLEAPRVLGEAVGAFALARTPTGVAIAYVEREHDLVVARLSAAFAAQNVPRVVERLAAPVSALAVASVTPAGALLAWSYPSEVRVMALDARSVPRGPSTVALDQPTVRALRFDVAGTATLRVDPADPAVDPWVLTLRADGSEVARSRWPIGALGPVRLGGAVLAAQINPQGNPMLLRSPADAAPTAIADPAVAPRARLDALAVDDDVVLALFSTSSNGRQALVRLLPDGSASSLTDVRGHLPGPSTFVVDAPSTVLLLTRDASHAPPRTVLQRYACRLPGADGATAPGR